MCNFYLLVLFSNLLLLLFLLFGIVVVHLGLREAGDEVVKDAKELVRLGGRRILAEHPANPVEPGAGGEAMVRKRKLQTSYSWNLFSKPNLAFMSVKRSSSSASLTLAMAMNSLMTAR